MSKEQVKAIRALADIDEVLKARIDRAIDVAVKYGGTDGDHHKAWVIDQMVRELTGCKPIMHTELLADGGTICYATLNESETYKELVNGVIADGYDWDKGIPP
jgi:hypothetical protein